MLRRLMEGLFLLLVLAVAGSMGAARYWQGPGEGFWWRAAELAQMPKDSGPVDPVQLTRRATPSDALVCPERVCQQAKADVVAPVFLVTAADLRRKVSLVALSEPRTVELPCTANCDKTARFVQYSAVFLFPDTIDVTVSEAGAKASTLAVYSRSLVGYGDQGVNRARVERWIAALHRITPES
jgi:uncharacterized protein (DUF1499 family)